MQKCTEKPNPEKGGDGGDRGKNDARELKRLDLLEDSIVISSYEDGNDEWISFLQE